MSKGELAYLILVITGMVVFIVTLAWVSRRPSDVSRPARYAPRSSLTSHPHGEHASAASPGR